MDDTLGTLWCFMFEKEFQMINIVAMTSTGVIWAYNVRDVIVDIKKGLICLSCTCDLIQVWLMFQHRKLHL